MTLSILTLVKNRTGHLLNQLEGLAQSDVPLHEIVVLDMSDDPIRLQPTDLPICSVRLETFGLPLARARNLAAREARGDQLLFLDVDCIPTPGLPRAIAAALEAEDALICAEVRYLPAGATQGGWTFDTLMSKAVPHPLRAFPLSGWRREPEPGLFWSLAFGIRRQTFHAMRGFDEGFTGYGAEDTDFGFRAHAADLPLLFMGGAGVFHQHHGVYDPPLQHFDDIIKNAQRFYRLWGRWAMEGWLKAFEARGLIAVGADQITVLRSPDKDEIEAARRSDDQPF